MEEFLEVIHTGLEAEEFIGEQFGKQIEKRKTLKYICGKCGRVVNQGTSVCPYCGGQISGIKCLKCGFIGSTVDLRDNRCPKCGAGDPVIHCSICGEPFPMRKPKNKRQALWG